MDLGHLAGSCRVLPGSGITIGDCTEDRDLLLTSFLAPDGRLPEDEAPVPTDTTEAVSSAEAPGHPAVRAEPGSPGRRPSSRCSGS